MSCVFRQYLVNLIALIFFSMLFDADGEGTISVATFRVSIERNIFQKIVKVIWGATRTGILTFKRTLTQTFFPGHSQRDWWNLLRWGIGRDLQRCKLFSFPTSQWHFLWALSPTQRLLGSFNSIIFVLFRWIPLQLTSMNLWKLCPKYCSKYTMHKM